MVGPYNMGDDSLPPIPPAQGPIVQKAIYQFTTIPLPGQDKVTQMEAPDGFRLHSVEPINSPIQGGGTRLALLVFEAIATYRVVPPSPAPGPDSKDGNAE